MRWVPRGLLFAQRAELFTITRRPSIGCGQIGIVLQIEQELIEPLLGQRLGIRLLLDQLGKRIGLEALGSSGVTVTHDEISPDAHHADLRHEPEPARMAARARLGLLGRLAGVVCPLEIFSGTPDDGEVIACLGKIASFQQRLVRRALKQENERQNESRSALTPRSSRAASLVDPFVWIMTALVWIMTARAPTAVLAKGAFGPAAGWPVGVSLSPALYRLG